MEKQAMQNGDLETAKKISEVKQGMVKDLADKDLDTDARNAMLKGV